MRNVILAIVLIVALFLSGVLVLVVLWWLLNKGRKDVPVSFEIGKAVRVDVEDLAPSSTEAAMATQPDEAPESEPAAGEAVGGKAMEMQAHPEPDDLTRIEGIGPKIASVLRAAGILTYGQLAENAVENLGKILEADSPRLRNLADPATWPEQAALAASGEWEALETLQGTLRRGRRPG